MCSWLDLTSSISHQNHFNPQETDQNIAPTLSHLLYIHPQRQCYILILKNFEILGLAMSAPERIGGRPLSASAQKKLEKRFGSKAKNTSKFTINAGPSSHGERRFAALPPGPHFTNVKEQMQLLRRDDVDVDPSTRLHPAMIINISCNYAAAEGKCRGRLAHDFGQPFAQTWDPARVSAMSSTPPSHDRKVRLLLYSIGVFSDEEKAQYLSAPPSLQHYLTQFGNPFFCAE